MHKQQRPRAASLLSRIEQFNEYQGPSPLQVAYLDFIGDEHAPIADRWAVFEAAPSAWKYHEAHRDADSDRNSTRVTETICCIELVNNFAAALALSVDSTLASQLLDAVREDILSSNLGSVSTIG